MRRIAARLGEGLGPVRREGRREALLAQAEAEGVEGLRGVHDHDPAAPLLLPRRRGRARGRVGLDREEERRGGDRLDDVVREPEAGLDLLLPLGPLQLLGQPREGDDGDPRPERLPQAPEELDPVHVRQRHVLEDEAGAGLRRQLQRGPPVGGLRHSEPAREEHLAEEAPRQRVVLHEEDGRGRRRGIAPPAGTRLTTHECPLCGGRRRSGRVFILGP